MKRQVPPGEQGAALLTVLLLVAVMGALAAAAFEKLRLSTALAANSAALEQARAFATGIESLLTLRVDDILAASPEKTTLMGGWNGAERQIPLPGGGIARATVRDGGNCFNINSLGEGDIPTALAPRPSGIAQFVGLMRALEIPEGSARRVAEAAGDWIDGDDVPSQQGAEDSAYAEREQPYRTGNTLFADVSELRALSGMTAEIYERVRPFLCALPAAELSPINVNTLTPEQAPLIAMLAPDQISLDAARQVIASRPVAGWSDLGEFYRTPGLAEVQIPGDILGQPQVKTSWFRIDLRIALREAELQESALVDARQGGARIVARTWGEVD
ncbi:type II secretion system minor pseudopilin GspK [Sphingomonas sp. LY54]|uniref:type II secretion system minor pseudopilin GspK n=1 Tax=Sphingomonas sp. LY54 TaxID=3095343 RepID=UPI002D7808F5|nr:type II secretion system minor pseudopilin GspK [Sphingomonas sp. LY54]WRP29315.1 type II secretion system minor pseudopilin GspK [Sphingomonas sp. LY54]